MIFNAVKFKNMMHPFGKRKVRTLSNCVREMSTIDWIRHSKTDSFLYVTFVRQTLEHLAPSIEFMWH